MMETVKAHPYITIGALLGGVALIVLLRGSGQNSVQQTAVDPSVVASGNALQVAQMNAQTQAAGMALQAQAHADDNATRIQLAKIQGEATYNVNQLQAGIASQQINATQQTVALQSSLTAQTQQASIAADVQKNQINATMSITNTANLVNAMVHNADTQRDVLMAQINADVTKTQINADASGGTVWDWLGF